MTPWITNDTQSCGRVLWCGAMLLGHWRGPLVEAMATLGRRTHKKNDGTATLPPDYYNHYILDEDQSTQVVNNHKYLVLMGSIRIVAVVLSSSISLLHCSHRLIVIAFVTWFLHSAVIIVVIIYHCGSDHCSCHDNNHTVILLLLWVDCYPALGCWLLHPIHCDDGLILLLVTTASSSDDPQELTTHGTSSNTTAPLSSSKQSHEEAGLN
jgi:hypothetical protein